MKKVLIITYYWPPGSSPGVQRFLKFTKYLWDFGWEPIVLTVENGTYPSMDESLLQDIDPRTKVYRTSSREPFRAFNLLSRKKGKSMSVGMIGLQNNASLLKKIALYIRANYFIPDARKGWNRTAFPKAISLIEKHEIKAIVTTGPPHSTHLIGLRLKKRLSIPWLVDLRDPWTNIYYNTIFPRSNRTIRKDKQLEDEVVKKADALTVVSHGLKNEFQNRAKQISIIYNGYDEEDFESAAGVESSTHFTLAYIGNFKPNQNIGTVWDALAELRKELPEFYSHFRIAITGNMDPKIALDLEKRNLAEVSDLHPFVPHSESISRMKKASLLLFIIPKTERNHLIITGKLFEYLASGTPLLAIGPEEGDAANVLREANRSRMIDYERESEIKAQILHAYQQWLDHGKRNPPINKGNINAFSRIQSTRKLSDLLNTIIHETS